MLLACRLPLPFSTAGGRGACTSRDAIDSTDSLTNTGAAFIEPKGSVL